MTNPVRYAVVHLPEDGTKLMVSLTESVVGVAKGWYLLAFDDECRSVIRGGPYEVAEDALRDPFATNECICPKCGLRHGGTNVDGGF